MKDALILLALGMGTVFILLYAINVMIVIMGKLIGPKKKELTKAQPKLAPAAEEPASPVARGLSQEELVLLFGAAVAAYLGTTPDKIRLVVRPVENSTAWSQAGRLEGMF